MTIHILVTVYNQKLNLLMDNLSKYPKDKYEVHFLENSDQCNQMNCIGHEPLMNIICNYNCNYYTFQNTGFWGAKNREWFLENVMIKPDDWIINSEADNLISSELLNQIIAADQQGYDMLAYSIVHHNVYGKAYGVIKPEIWQTNNQLKSSLGTVDWVSFAVKFKHLKATGIVEPEKIDSDHRTFDALLRQIKDSNKLKIIDQILVIKN